MFLIPMCLVASGALWGCKGRTAEVIPKVEITAVPPAGEGGPDRVVPIAGRATGARPDQHVVLYARAGVWWIQPDAHHSEIAIQPDSTWSSTIHFGTDYAALLVDRDYKPSRQVDALPTAGGHITAITIVKGRYAPSEAPPTLHFSGYEWKIHRATSNRNGFVSSYDPTLASVDSKGFMHLKIAMKDAKPVCSEVTLAWSWLEKQLPGQKRSRHLLWFSPT